MISFSRTDRSVMGCWWWTIDRWSMAALALLMVIGALLIMAASPAVAERIGAEHFHFVRRQFLFVPPALLLMVVSSLASPRLVRRLACLGLVVSVALMIATLGMGQEVKGAARWLSLGGLSLQPSEFVKPSFAVVAAWMFASQQQADRIPGNLVALALYLLVACLLLLQPDVGMTLVISAVWFVEFFLAGLPLLWVVMATVSGLAGLVGAYFAFSHVQARVDSFLDPAAGNSYQVMTALQAFHNGGLFGRGPGEGRVKAVLPDAHTDFIMAVAGEEFGLVLCLLVVGLFGFVVLRGFTRMLAEENLFVLLAASGLLVQFGLQAIINLASTLRLMPTKGMTLPFISYGGSSTLALALGMGMMLALTRKRYGREAAL
jgi:cell division protein FtsW